MLLTSLTLKLEAFIYLANYQKNAPFSRVYKHCSLGSALSSILCSNVFVLSAHSTLSSASFFLRCFCIIFQGEVIS